MIINNEPYLIEYNVRMGDPECQTILPKLETDLTEVFLACCNQNLDKIDLKWLNKKSVCVVASSYWQCESVCGSMSPVCALVVVTVVVEELVHGWADFVGLAVWWIIWWWEAPDAKTLSMSRLSRAALHSLSSPVDTPSS